MKEDRRSGWPRFWYPLHGTVRFDDHGYVLDAESTVLYPSLNPDLVPFEKIRHTPILALLGEPGSGKTYALRGEFEALHAAGARAGRIDLREYSDESRLIRDAFEGDWIGAEGERYLFIDSLDEALIRIETLSSVLLAQLERLPRAGLFVRIACRTAEWPRSLHDGLKEFAQDAPNVGGGGSYGAYVLAPLRRRDVAQAAAHAGIDAEAFLDRIERIPAVPLAIKPLTLSLLLTTFRGQDEPLSQVELYDRGCRYLLEESDVIRRERRNPTTTAAQRLAMAETCAAALILGGRRALWRDADRGQVPPDDVLVDDIAHHASTTTSPVTVAQVREVLRGTAMFTARDQVEEVAFAHQTYGEYLAARSLVGRDLPLAQLVELLTQGEAQVVIPQLRETAAWLAQMREDFYQFLLERDPKVLLRSNVATSDHARRKDLVSALFRLYAEGLLFDDWDARHYYTMLAHPDLAQQIRPLIVDPSRPSVVRAGAIALAETNVVEELGPELLRVALDPSTDVDIRIDAARAVARLGSRQVREQMRPLLRDAHDRDHQLRGYALRALWPEIMTAPELFSELGPEGRVDLFGAYKGFLLFDLVRGLNDDDVVEALNWVRDRSADQGGFPFHYEGLADRIVARAVSLIGDDAVRRALSEALIARQRHRHEMLSERDLWSALDSEAIRRAIAATAVEIDGAETVPAELTHGQPSLLRATERAWTLAQGLAAVSPELARRWALVLEMLAPTDDRAILDQIFYATETSQAFADVFERYFAPIPLASEGATWLRQQEQRRRQRPALLDPTPAARIDAALRAIEASEVQRWWILNREMTLDVDSTHYEFHRLFEPDLRKFIGWKEASDETRARIIAAARRVVLEYQPGPSDWLGSDTFKEPDFAGYRAFALLLAEDRAFVERLEAETWKRWAVVLAGYPALGDDDAVQRELLAFALPHARSDLIGAFDVLLRRDCRKHDQPFFLRSIPERADPHVADLLMALLADRRTKPACSGPLLERLLVMKDARAADWATQHIRRPGRSRTRQRRVAVQAARAFLLADPRMAWPPVWRALNKTPDYGRDVFLSLAEVWDRTDWLATLSESEAGDAYRWLEREFPHLEDPRREGVVPPRAHVAELRDRVIARLGNLGTPEAVAALRKIRAAFAAEEYRWIDRIIVNAIDLAAARSWRPLGLRELAALVGDRRRHLIETERSLQDTVVEALGRLQRELHDETPAVVDLWEQGQGRVHPKDELSLSNYVKRFLKRDLSQNGIAVNREVEIRDSRATGVGQILDLRVDAVRDAKDDKFDVVSVFVEVKPSWSEDVVSAMRTQLVERYLQETTVRHGVYVVGWFASSRWEPRDRRRARSQRRSLDQIRSDLASEAKQLSGEDLRVVPVVLDVSLHDDRNDLVRSRRRSRSHATQRTQSGITQHA